MPLASVLVGILTTFVLAARSASWHAGCYVQDICDSMTFRVVAEMLAAGQNPYSEAARLAHVSASRLAGFPPPFDLPFQYPPNALLLFAPRGWATVWGAHVAITVATTALFLGLALRLARRDLPTTEARVWLVASLAFSGAATLNTQLGQTGALAAALVVGAVLWWRHAPLVAGAFVGVLAFKPQYAVPLALVALVRRDTQVLVGAVTAFAVMTVASGLAFGFVHWWHFAAVASVPNDTADYMVNWMGLLASFAPGHPLIAQGALPVFAAATAGLGLFLWRVRDQATLGAQLALALAVAVVISPNTHPYDLVVLTPALVYVSNRWGGIAVGPAFLLLTWVLLPPPPRWLLGVALVGFALLSLWLLIRETGQVTRQNGQ